MRLSGIGESHPLCRMRRSWMIIMNNDVLLNYLDAAKDAGFGLFSLANNH